MRRSGERRIDFLHNASIHLVERKVKSPAEILWGLQSFTNRLPTTHRRADLERDTRHKAERDTHPLTILPLVNEKVWEHVRDVRQRQVEADCDRRIEQRNRIAVRIRKGEGIIPITQTAQSKCAIRQAIQVWFGADDLTPVG